MDIRKSSRFARSSTWFSNLVVLLLLGAVGWWGHANHWTLPRFSQVLGSARGAAESKSSGKSSPDGSPAHSDISEFPNRLPAIIFSSAEAAQNCGIETEVAEQRSMDDVVVANGVVGYDQTHLAQLAVRVPGIVWRVEKRLGDTVRRGDVLVIVDSAEVGQAKATLLEAAVVHQLKAQNLKHLKEIKTSISERSIREVEAAWEVSRVQRFNAVQKLANLGFPIRLEEIDRLTTDELTERLQLLGLPESLGVETSSANLIPLIAPFNGIITNCEVVRGEMVEPSKPQYVVADISRMWINLDVRQNDATRLHLGATVMFHSERALQPVPSTLTWIGTEVDPRTRTIQARAEAENRLLDNPQASTSGHRLLQANTFGSAHIQIGSNPSALVVPNDAVLWQWEIKQYVVFVSSEDRCRFEPRIVTKGLVRDASSQILAGLREGELVVTAGTRILSSELSDRLQPLLGENSEAIRNFDDARTPVSTTP